MASTLTSSRPTNLPSEGCPPLCPRRGDYHRLLGCVFILAGRGLDVVSPRESEKDPVHFSTRVCETRESRVSDLQRFTSYFANF